MISPANPGLSQMNKYRAASRTKVNRYRIAACINKKAFGRLEKAEAEIYRSHRGDSLMVPYLCPFCHNWHIGHRNKGKGNKQ